MAYGNGADGRQSNTPVILIAEPETLFRAELERFSVEHGMEVHIADNLDSVITMIEENGPDYVVVDQILPSAGPVDLATVAKTAKCANKKNRTVIVSRYPSLSYAVKFVKQGAWDYIAKPTSAQVVLNSLIENTTITPCEKPQEEMNALSVNRLEWEHIQRMLQVNNDNISATARALGMHRRTLQRKLSKFPAVR